MFDTEEKPPRDEFKTVLSFSGIPEECIEEVDEVCLTSGVKIQSSALFLCVSHSRIYHSVQMIFLFKFEK